jgi:hypothetical protein
MKQWNAQNAKGDNLHTGKGVELEERSMYPTEIISVYSYVNLSNRNNILQGL